MFWDDLIRRWRKEERGNSRALLQAAAGHVAVLPAPRRSRPLRPIVVVFVLLVLLAALLGPGRDWFAIKAAEGAVPAASVSAETGASAAGR